MSSCPWAKQTWRKLKATFNECLNPNCKATEDLDFCHLRSTGLNGKGRGIKAIIADIRRHPDSYSRLCHDCHKQFDDGELEGWKPVSLLQAAIRAKLLIFPVQRKGARVA